MRKIGIDAIDYYIPPIALPIKDLAEARNIEAEKLEFGLGLKSMAIPDIDEDTASFAANALLKLILNNKIDPRKIGRIPNNNHTIKSTVKLSSLSPPMKKPADIKAPKKINPTAKICFTRKMIFLRM